MSNLVYRSIISFPKLVQSIHLIKGNIKATSSRKVYSFPVNDCLILKSEPSSLRIDKLLVILKNRGRLRVGAFCRFTSTIVCTVRFKILHRWHLHRVSWRGGGSR